MASRVAQGGKPKTKLAPRLARAPRAAKPVVPEPDELDEDELDEDADADEDADEGSPEDENQLGLTPEQAAELDAYGLIDQIGEGGAARANLRIKFRRVLRPEDMGVPGVSAGFVGSFPNARVLTIQADRIEDDVLACFGGGAFGLDFFLNGKYQRGYSKTLDIAGPAKPRGQTDGSPPAGTQPSPSASTAPGDAPAGHAPPVAVAGPLTAESVQRLIAETLAASKREERLATLERENEELRQGGDPSARKASDVSVTDLASMVFKQVQTFSTQLNTAASESPEAQAARARAEAAEERLRAAEKRLEEQEKAENQRRFDRIERLLRKKPKKAGSPISSVTGMLLEMTALDAFVGKIKRQSADDEEGGGMLSKFLAIAAPELEAIGTEVIRDLRKSMKKQQGQAPPERRIEHQSRPVTSASEIDHQGWMDWLNAILQAPSLVQNVAHVQEGIRRFGPHVSRLIMIDTREALFPFIRECVNEETAKIFEAAPPDDVAKLLQAIQVLRGTVLSLAATPAPAPRGADDGRARPDDGAKITKMPPAPGDAAPGPDARPEVAVLPPEDAGEDDEDGECAGADESDDEDAEEEDGPASDDIVVKPNEVK